MWTLGTVAISRPVDSFSFLLPVAGTDTNQTKLFCSCGVPAALSPGSCDSRGCSRCQSAEKEQAPHSQRPSEGGPIHFQKLLCASYELLGTPMKLEAVWSCEGHHWGLESLAEAKRLDPCGQGPWADPILILGFFLWVGPSISGPRTVTFQNLPVHSAPSIARLRADFLRLGAGGLEEGRLLFLSPYRTLMVQASFWAGTMSQCCLAAGV